MQEGKIEWRQWSPEAFNEARHEDRLVLLYISATWCHWCHVMEEDTLTHPEVIRLISDHYIPVRVDSDRRPDINNRYNMGGWPSVVILTTQGDVITGETYLPTGSMLQMLHQVYQQYHSGEKGPAEQHAREDKKRTESLTVHHDLPVLGHRVIQNLGDCLKRTFDRQFGGFMGPTKFPMPHVLELAMILYRRDGESHWLRMVTETLDAMREGEIHDHLDGGFFRYSVTDDWSQPHFEKMLETQALLLPVYLSAYQITGELKYRVTAQDMIQYAMNDLLSPTGSWFCGSQTADQEYYSSEEEERLHLGSPAVDQTLYVNWNALMVRGLLKAAIVLKEPDYEAKGLEILDGLTAKCIVDGIGAIHYIDEKGPGLDGFLGDQSAFVHALLDAYELYGHQRFLEQAIILLDTAIEGYWDEEAGAFRDRRAAPEESGWLSKAVFPISENAQMAQALLRGAFLAGHDRYQSKAETLLAAFLERYESYRLFGAPYALAMDQFYQPAWTFSILASHGDPIRKEFVDAILALAEPWAIIEHLDLEIDAHQIEARGYPPSDKTVVYACMGRQCLPPVFRPHELKEHINRFSGKGVRNG